MDDSAPNRRTGNGVPFFKEFVMTETMSVMEPVTAPRAPKSRTQSHQLRKEVHNMLRDVAFVLAQTRRVREEILKEQQSKKISGIAEQIAAGS
jgi:sensor histidine kinase regulating citrate/malate metabolism